MSRELNKAVVEASKNYRMAIADFGMALAMIKEGRQYADVFGDPITWVDYLAQPEIGLTPIKAQRMIDMSTYYADSDEALDIPPDSVTALVKVGHTKQNFDDARYLTTKDLKEKIFEDKEPEAEQTYTYLVMKKSDQTGNLSKVCGVSNEEVEQFINQHGH